MEHNQRNYQLWELLIKYTHMKTHKSNKINLKKLTIAKISLSTMNAVNGGSSVPLTEEIGYCRATAHARGGACVDIY